MKTLQIKTFLTCWLLSSLLFLTGCSVWEEDVPSPEDSRQITLVYQQLTTTDVITRAIQTTDELKIGNLYTIFYKSDKSLAGISVTELNTESDSGTVSLILPDGVNASEAYNIYLLANLEGYVNQDGSYADVKAWLGAALSGSTYDTATGILEGITKAPIADGITAPYLPMFGKTSKTAASNTIGANLTRLVSRVDLYVEHAKLPTTNFQLESAEIWNARKYTKLLTGSSTDLSKDDFEDYSNNVATPSLDDINGIDYIEAKLYAFPNYQAATEKGDRVTTCLIIGGSYNGGTTTYYRLNIKPKTGSQVLKPNHRYKIKITAVSGPGAEKEEDAYKESDAKISYEIDDWKPGDMGDGITDIHGNKLNASPAQVVFSYLAGQTAKVNILKTLKGTDPGDVTVDSSDPDNFSANLSSDGLSFEIKVLTDNYGNEDREAHVMVKWGTMEVPVYISQLGATSTAGGLRAAPNALHFGATESTQSATLLVSGDLSGISASQITYKVLNTENDLDDSWCTIDGGFTESSTGLYTFTVKAAKMKDNASYVRSAVIYFTMTKTNGEILNATMSVRQSPGSGGGSGSAIAVNMFEWISTGSYPAADVETGYQNHAINGFNTDVFRGFPTDKIGTRHLHFSVVEHQTLKYRITMPNAQTWRIVVKGNAVGKISFTKTTGNPGDVVWITASSDPLAPWVDGSFVVEYGDGSEDEFFVYQMGVVSRLKNAIYYKPDDYNGKIYYYGVIVINGVTWLDRNLGASSNGFFSNATTGVANTKLEENRGAYFGSVTTAEAACPAGFRLPTFALKTGETKDVNTDDEWGYVYRNSTFSGANGTPLVSPAGVSGTYKLTWYVGLNSKTTPDAFLIPLCGDGYTTAYSDGNYWYAGGYVYFYADGSKERTTSTSYTDGYSARCVRK